MSDILYSKLRLEVPQALDGENATITSSKGAVRTVEMSSPITDIMLAGMEKYRIQQGTLTDENVCIGCGQIKKVEIKNKIILHNIRDKIIKSADWVSVVVDEGNNLYLVYQGIGRNSADNVIVWKYDVILEEWVTYCSLPVTGTFQSSNNYANIYSGAVTTNGYVMWIVSNSQSMMKIDVSINPSTYYANHLMVLNLNDKTIKALPITYGGFYYNAMSMYICAVGDDIWVGAGNFYENKTSYNNSSTYIITKEQYTSNELISTLITKVSRYPAGDSKSGGSYFYDGEYVYYATNGSDSSYPNWWGRINTTQDTTSSWTNQSPQLDPAIGVNSASSQTYLYGAKLIVYKGEIHLIGGYTYNASGSRHAIRRNNQWIASPSIPTFSVQYQDLYKSKIVIWNNGIEDIIIIKLGTGTDNYLYTFDGTSWTYPSN